MQLPKPSARRYFERASYKISGNEFYVLYNYVNVSSDYSTAMNYNRVVIKRM